MIVEDNTLVAEDYRECLENLGYTVTSVVAAGEEAVERADLERPDAVLMDIHLRDKMSGIDAAEQIFARFDIPILFLSAYSDHELLELTKQLGSFGYLIKPPKEEEIYSMLEITLYKYNAEKKRKQMEARIRQAQKMEAVGSLAGGIAHDFNNLLSVILGNISLAEFDLKPEDNKYELMKEAKDATLKAKDLTSRLLTFSSGGDPDKKTTSIKELIKDSIKPVREGSFIDFVISIPDDLSAVQIDKVQIKQVFHNIVINAREAISGKGKIHINCENITIGQKDDLRLNSGKYVKVTINDDGAGISKENLPKIFDPYFSTKEMGIEKGVGLGLSVSFSVIEKHGGLITVESEPGAGSTFSIYLPASKIKIEEVKPVIESKLEMPLIGNGRMLVMDDEELIRTMAIRIFGRFGYDVVVCEEGRQTIEMYKKARESGNPFDLVILDLTINAGMGGLETIKRLKEIDPSVKAIVSSGYSIDNVMTDYKTYGFTSVLIKPYSMKELEKALKEVSEK